MAARERMAGAEGSQHAGGERGGRGHGKRCSCTAEISMRMAGITHIAGIHLPASYLLAISCSCALREHPRSRPANLNLPATTGSANPAHQREETARADANNEQCVVGRTWTSVDLWTHPRLTECATYRGNAPHAMGFAAPRRRLWPI
jgi:hypothetical protein